MADIVHGRATDGCDASNRTAAADRRSWTARMAFELAGGGLPRRTGGGRVQRSGDARGAEPRNPRPHRQRGCGGNVGSMAARRHGRCVAPPLYRGRPTGVRRDSAPLSRRPSVPRDDNSLHTRVRAPVGENRPERPRRRRSGGPIFCPTPAKSTRSSLTPQDGLAKRVLTTERRSAIGDLSNHRWLVFAAQDLLKYNFGKTMVFYGKTGYDWISGGESPAGGAASGFERRLWLDREPGRKIDRDGSVIARSSEGG